MPNSLSFRMVSTITVTGKDEIPPGYTGRVRFQGHDGVDRVLWLDRGQLDDPSADVPAYTHYRAGGAVKQERHYRLGRLHDPEPGVPAVRGYFADGTLKYAEHFRYGWRQDAGDTPAIRKWRADGTLRTTRRYVDDVRIDPPPNRRQRNGVGTPIRALVDASPRSRTKQ